MKSINGYMKHLKHYVQYIDEIEKYTENDEELELVIHIKAAYEDLMKNGNTVLTMYYKIIDSMQR